MSAYILNLEQAKKQVDTLKSFSSPIWLIGLFFGHFLLKVSKKRRVRLLYHHDLQERYLFEWIFLLLPLTELQYHYFLPEPFLFQLSFIKYFFHELLWIVHLNAAHYLLDLDFRTVHAELQKYCCMHIVHTTIMGIAHRKYSPDMLCFPTGVLV